MKRAAPCLDPQLLRRRTEQAEADKAKLNEDIKTLEGEMAEMDAAQAEATKVRQQEHEEYLGLEGVQGLG